MIYSVARYQSSYWSVSFGTTTQTIGFDKVHQKVDKQHISQKHSKFNNFCSYRQFTKSGTSIVDNRYYSVSSGARALNISHDADPEEVGNNVCDKNPLNSIVLHLQVI